MSFDEYYLSENPYVLPAPSDAFDGDEAFYDHKDPLPDVEDYEMLPVEKTIQDNAAWLQEQPRRALAIIAALFPTCLSSMSDFEDVSKFIGGYLFDAGYSPQYDNSRNPTWHWLEGEVQGSSNNESEVSKWAEPMTSEEFRLVWDQIKGA